jgi:hypothetical protein
MAATATDRRLKAHARDTGLTADDELRLRLTTSAARSVLDLLSRPFASEFLRSDSPKLIPATRTLGHFLAEAISRHNAASRDLFQHLPAGAARETALEALISQAVASASTSVAGHRLELGRYRRFLVVIGPLPLAAGLTDREQQLAQLTDRFSLLWRSERIGKPLGALHALDAGWSGLMAQALPALACATTLDLDPFRSLWSAAAPAGSGLYVDIATAAATTITDFERSFQFGLDQGFHLFGDLLDLAMEHLQASPTARSA